MIFTPHIDEDDFELKLKGVREGSVWALSFLPCVKSILQLRCRSLLATYIDLPQKAARIIYERQRP